MNIIASVSPSIHQAFWAPFKFGEFETSGTSEVENDRKIPVMMIVSETGLIL
jgi:hypothetical protein